MYYWPQEQSKNSIGHQPVKDTMDNPYVLLLLSYVALTRSTKRKGSDSFTGLMQQGRLSLKRNLKGEKEKHLRSLHSRYYTNFQDTRPAC